VTHRDNFHIKDFVKLLLNPTLNIRLELENSYFDFCLPKTEKKLYSHTKYQEALRFIANKETMESYHNIIDFILCESFPELKNPCFNFYNNKGNTFKEQTPKNIIESYDRVLSEVVLEMILILFENKINKWDYITETLNVLLLIL